MSRHFLTMSCALAVLCTWVVAGSAMAGDDHKAAEVGHQAPLFVLTDTNGEEHSLEEYTKDGKIVVLEWFNQDCPVCARHAKAKSMVHIVNEFKDENIVFLGIDSTHFHEGKEADINKKIKEWNLNYPILTDFDGKVGKMYGAKTTPHMFIIDTKGMLVYAGAIDDDRSGSKSESERTNYVVEALDQVTAGETVATSKTKPYGCSVKYKKD